MSSQNTYPLKHVARLSPDELTFLRRLRGHNPRFFFYNAQKFQLLKDNLLRGPAEIVNLIGGMRKAKFHFDLYFPSGQRFALTGIRLNKHGCIRLSLPHPIIIRSKELWFHSCLHPGWSYFRFVTDPAFPTKEQIESLKLFMDVLDEERQLTSEDEREGVHLNLQQDYTEEHEVIFNFINHFPLAGGKDVYLFFRHSPFARLKEEGRKTRLAFGNVGLRRYVNNISRNQNRKPRVVKE